MRSLLKFFVLTYALTWVCFITVVKMSHASGAAHGMTLLRGPLLFLGTFAPALIALGVTAHDQGGRGVRALLRGIVQWRVNWRWYLFALAYMPIVKLSVAIVYRFTTGLWPRLGTESWYIIVVAIVLSTPVQAGEEIGWRGYALPRLASRFGFRWASIILGVIWACWHLPLFFLPGADKYYQSFPVWTLQVVALSVAITLLYARTNGSLLLTMLMHSAVNQTVGIVPSANPNAVNPLSVSVSLVMSLTVVFLWITAAYFLLRMPDGKTASSGDQQSLRATLTLRS
jgi:membrane protease YdiL (CAAX protease family)